MQYNLSSTDNGGRLDILDILDLLDLLDKREKSKVF